MGLKNFTIKKRKKSKNRLNRNIRSKKNTRYKKRGRSIKKNKKRILRGGMEAPMTQGLEDPLTYLGHVEEELDELLAQSDQSESPALQLKKKMDTLGKDPEEIIGDINHYCNPGNYSAELTEPQKKAITDKCKKLYPKIKKFTALIKEIMAAQMKALQGRQDQEREAAVAAGLDPPPYSGAAAATPNKGKKKKKSGKKKHKPTVATD